MPQKPLDASDNTVRLTLRLPKRLTDEVNELRGTFTRSEYLRQLIEIGLLAMRQVKTDDRPRLIVETGTEVMKRLKIVPEGVHRHHYVKDDEPIRFTMKGALRIPVYRSACTGCPETKEE
jgi:hypothetical protein